MSRCPINKKNTNVVTNPPLDASSQKYFLLLNFLDLYRNFDIYFEDPISNNNERKKIAPLPQGRPRQKNIYLNFFDLYGNFSI